jgi:hypothetical protein
MEDFEKLGLFYLGRERDLSTLEGTSKALLYDSRDLTTHGVIVGMTGSGKTGLGISLLEEAALDGIPAIVVDPKGDLGNLLLTFPELRPTDFSPWVDQAEAASKGLSVDELAARTAELWRKGLSDWGQEPARIERFRAAVDLCIFTPGSTAGLPISVLKSLSAPPRALLDDADAIRERVMATVSGLLSLVGIEADPVRSREHILLSKIVERAWSEQRELELAHLIRDVQSPPFDRVGVLDIETFYPAKDRTDLALVFNNVLASPGFAAWMEGEPLDVARLLWTPAGRPRLSILSIAHLSDPERMFFVTVLLNEVVAWMRTQTGASSLRALLYMDEVFGFFPPVANPPSKLPMLTLFKQARAFGLGVVVATQNPVDLDYKGLSNAGTWFLGRLQTERDKARVLEGLEGASAAAGKAFDQARYDRLLAGLGNRVFLMNNVHEDLPVLFQTRWALSYLRGPLTRTQIQALMASRKEVKPVAEPRAPAAPPAAVSGQPVTTDPTAATVSDRPLLPLDIAEAFLAVRHAPAAGSELVYRPSVLAIGRVHFVDAKLGLDHWEEVARLAPVRVEQADVSWEDAERLEDRQLSLEREPESRARFAALPGFATRARSYASWVNELERHLYRTHTLSLSRCPTLKLTAEPLESEGEFRVRAQQALRDRRAAEIDALRERYATRLTQLQDQQRRAEERVQREAAQYEQQKLQAVVSVGASLLGALFGRRRLSTGALGGVTSAARGLGRAARERGDVGRVQESVEILAQRRADLEAELEAGVSQIAQELAAERLSFETAQIRLRKSDISVERITLVWVPWWIESDGTARPAYV